MRRFEVALAGFLAALNALVLWEGWRVSGRLAADSNTDPLNAGRYLLIIGAVLTAASVAWMAGRLAHHRKLSGSHPPGDGDRPAQVDSGRTMITIACCVAYALLLPYAGFALANLALLSGLFLFLSHYGLPRSLAGGAAVALGLHLLFVVWLGVPVPRLGWVGL